MLSVWPSQIDTWLNLLPNAAYLFDHDRLPTAQLPPSYSFLPVAPYNTQFADYLASLAAGGFADGAMGLFNAALLCAAALLLARALAGTAEGTPPWWACAVGLLLVGPLNPGFVPRFFISPYGEAPLAVTALFAVWLAAEFLGDLARGIAWPRSLAPLALVLAALVNTKQSGIGLLVPIGVTMLVLARADPAITWRRALPAIAAALVPSVALYLLWRAFALNSGFTAGELKPLAFADWNIALLPQIVVALLVAMFRKATFFLFVAALLALAARRLRRDPWSPEGRLLGMIAGVVILFNGFLLFTYVAHFPPEWALGAHSYFRYNTQVSLLVMLGLVVALRPWAAAWFAANARLAARAGRAAWGWPCCFRSPACRCSASTATRHSLNCAGLAMRLPPTSSQATGWRCCCRGTARTRSAASCAACMLFTAPRRPGLDFRIETSVSPATLASVAAADYRLALVTCAPAGLDGVPAGDAAMLRATPDGWHVLQTWAWPERIKHRHFAGLLARDPLCAGPRPG